MQSVLSSLEFDGGGHIEYLYSATGTKLAEKVYDAEGSLIARRDYVGQFEFVADTLERTLLPEGFITEADGTFHAFIPDHQGNITGVYNSATNALEQFTDYYPYGLPHASATSPEANRRKYGAKELTTDHGLNLYDFAARFQNPAFPHFTTPAPLATDYYPTSPYVYCGADPINLVDPTGMNWVKRIHDNEIEYIYDRNVTCAEDIERIYGQNSGYEYIDTSKTWIINGVKIKFTNDTKENKYGKATVNGKPVDSSNIYNGDGFIIFGTEDDCVDPTTLHQNYFGTDYTGPDNPKKYLKKISNGKVEREDSYQYPPQSKRETTAFTHDKSYDVAGAKGPYDAFLNIDKSVIKADGVFTIQNVMTSYRKDTNIEDRLISVGSAFVFGHIVVYKCIAKSIVNFGRKLFK